MNTDSFYANIPGYTLHSEAIQRVEERLREVQEMRSRPMVTAESLADLALSGHPFPDNRAHDPARTTAEATAIDHMRMDYRRAKGVLEGRRAQLLVTHAPFILNAVEDELLSIVEQVKVHTQILGQYRVEADVYRTRDDAKIDAWEALIPLTRDYESVRGVQYQLYHAASTGKPYKELSQVADFANSFDVLPTWREARQAAFNSSNATSSGVTAYLDWLKGFGEAQVPHLPHGFRASAHGPAELISIALHSRPWAPTIEVVLDLLGAGNRMVGFDVTRDGLASRENSRDKWFELTGTNPVTAYENHTNGHVPSKSIRRTGHESRTLADIMKMNLS